MTTLLVAGIVAFARAQQFSTCTGTPNMLDIYTDRPTLIKTVKNGYLYQVPQDPPLNIAHIYGDDAYTMGYALGQLVGDQMKALVDAFPAYIEEQLQPYIGFLPQAWQDAIAVNGTGAALRLTAEITAPYTPVHFREDVQGQADGSGIPFDSLYHIAMFPELIQAACSMFGAWGPATEDADKSLVVLRALDWGTDGPFQQYPLVTVFHPTGINGHTFAQMGWSGLTGAITGYSPKMAVCEKVWISYNGTDSRAGYPWTFLMRDILQFDENTEAAMNRIENAKRTCSIHLGLGDHTSLTFQAVEYAHEYAYVYNVSYTNHTYWPTLPFINKHVQPSEDPCLNDLLTKYFGQISAETTLRYITSLHQTGDMHTAIYDYANEYMYVSNAGVSTPMHDGQPSYDRQFVRLDMAALFALPPPSQEDL